MNILNLIFRKPKVPKRKVFLSRGRYSARTEIYTVEETQSGMAIPIGGQEYYVLRPDGSIVGDNELRWYPHSGFSPEMVTACRGRCS